MKANKLVVAEAFYSIQGEGISAGIPAVFLRLGGCNLLCKGRWICDTIDVWQHGVATDFEYVLSDQLIVQLKLGARLIVTGGEPLLQQEQLVKYFNWMDNERSITPIVEVETNGTIVPSSDMLWRVNQWNVSPKLQNSGVPEKERINGEALKLFARIYCGAWFKFVVTSVSDWNDIRKDYPIVRHSNIVLMPGADTREELDELRPRIIEMCKTHGVRYSDRLHIAAWDKKTGV